MELIERQGDEEPPPSVDGTGGDRHIDSVGIVATVHLCRHPLVRPCLLRCLPSTGDT